MAERRSRPSDSERMSHHQAIQNPTAMARNYDQGTGGQHVCQAATTGIKVKAGPFNHDAPESTPLSDVRLMASARLTDRRRPVAFSTMRTYGRSRKQPRGTGSTDFPHGVVWECIRRLHQCGMEVGM